MLGLLINVAVLVALAVYAAIVHYLHARRLKRLEDVAANAEPRPPAVPAEAVTKLPADHRDAILKFRK